MSVLQTPANHVAEFLDTKGSGLRTPLSVAVSDSLGKIKDDPLQPRKLDPLTEPLQDLKRKTTDFKSRLRSFKDRKASKAGDLPDLKRTHTFEEVVALLEAASNEYQSKKGILPKIWRVFRDNCDAFQGWMKLLPDGGEYTSAVCGSFKMIITAAVKAKEIREDILDAVACIPKNMGKATAQIQLYESEKLAEGFRDFYASVLEACECIMKWLSKSPANRGMKAFFQQGAYGKEVRSKLDAVERMATEVASQSTICFQQRVKYMEQISEKNLENSSATNDTTNTVLGLFYSFLQHYYEDKDKAEDFQGEIMKQLTRLSIQNQRGKKASGRNPEQLLELLSSPNTDYVDDLQRVLSIGKAMDMRGQERTERLIRGPELKKWITAGRLELLFIDGNTPGLEKTSPLSYASALLRGALENFGKGVIALAFFCGLHTNSQNPNTGARELMTALVHQLLSQRESFDTSFLAHRNTAELLGKSPRSLSTLLLIFGRLVQQLPDHAVVFCLIDGVRHYEARGRQEDLATVFSLLREMTESAKISATFKVLITNRTAPSPSSRRCFHAHQVVKLPREIEARNQGFNVLSWQHSARRDFSLRSGRRSTTDGDNAVGAQEFAERRIREEDDSDWSSPVEDEKKASSESSRSDCRESDEEVATFRSSSTLSRVIHNY